MGWKYALKLLFDQNLPPSLSRRLTDLGAEFAHVTDFAMKAADDAAIWELAKRGSWTTVTKDKDFRSRVAVYGAPPRVVLLQIGDCPVEAADGCLRRAWPFVVKLDADASASLLLVTQDAAFLLHEHRA